MLESNTILVTGCAGFIGSNLCNVLLDQGRKVIGIDNFSTGHQQNITHLMNNNNFVFTQADIRDRETMEKIIIQHNIQYISHQAARASVPKSVEDPLLTNDINITGTLNLLWLAKQHNIKRFVCAISSSVYGNTPTLPKIETMPYHPESPYAITKAAKEMYCKVFYELYGLPTIGLRYFNVYGPRQDPKGAYAAVIPRRIQAALYNQDLLLNGEGKQTRDFTYIDDVVAINIQALTSQNQEARGKGYNVAFGERSSIRELGEHIIDELGSTSTLVSAPERQGDIQDSFADISLAEDLLGYAPKTSLSEGIAKTIQRYTENKDYFTV